MQFIGILIPPKTYCIIFMFAFFIPNSFSIHPHPHPPNSFFPCLAAAVSIHVVITLLVSVDGVCVCVGGQESEHCPALLPFVIYWNVVRRLYSLSFSFDSSLSSLAFYLVKQIALLEGEGIFEGRKMDTSGCLCGEYKR